MSPQVKKIRDGGLSQKELADKCNVTPRHLRAVMSGKRESTALLRRVSQFTGK